MDQGGRATGSGCGWRACRLPLCALVGLFMPTPTATTDLDEVISSSRALTTYFREASKPRAQWRVGVEQEKIPVYADGRPAAYDGPRGIAALMDTLESRGFAAEKEDGHIIAVERGSDRITLEPGGQLELSGPALVSAEAGRKVLVGHIREVQEAARPLGIHFIAGGFRPFGSIEDVPWLPKRRYVVMRDYLPTRGRLGHEMMKRTATVQANLDFADEADAAAKIRLAFGVTSVVTALFAASPISDGAPNGHKSYRAAVWLDMDEDRCGLLPFVFEPGFGFQHYVEWALDVPMFFVVRAGVYHPVGGMSFRRFLQEGWQGQRATMRDWEIHLSTLFPEVRLKRYIEVRGADSAPLPMAQALAALWRGLLEDAEARAAAWALVESWPYVERLRLRREVPAAGLAVRVAGKPLADLALELVNIARAGLGRLAEGRDDQPLLDPMLAYAKAGRCPADDMLDDFMALGGDPKKLVERWEFKV
jgi:glutamate--cysteine ligase